MPRGRQPGVIYQQPVVDLDTFRGYLATRRQYSGTAIAVRLLLREVPPAITDAPDLLAWIVVHGQPSEVLVYVQQARSAYAEARRARARAGCGAAGRG
jgi:hypothetical protein